jgi:SulP family sulfate permease
MFGLLRYLSFLDLRDYRLSSLRRDFLASLTVTFLDIPQCVAYAMIAGLPPEAGLYAAAVPAVVGALFRSSQQVVTGPTNALSLLVGSAVAAEVARGGVSPVEVGITLAFMVGALQFLAGLLRLDTLADYISHPVVRGYLTGAAILIAVGQLPNITSTQGASGNLLHMLAAWVKDLSHLNPLAVTFALGTTGVVLGLRRLAPRLPGALIAMLMSIAVVSLFPLHEHGLRLVTDLTPIPAGLPPFTIPHFAHWTTLAPAAIACAVLSLVESSSVARSLAARTGQQLDLSAEFAGQGLANLAAAFSGAYPVSGSIGRSALNLQSGAESRLAAAFCGVSMLAVLLFFGPIVGRTPIASLAGMLLVLAHDLIDYERIRITLHGTKSDRAAFVATAIGAWLLPLDQAIYLGVGISLVLFLRRARLLTIREMVIGPEGRFREADFEVGEMGKPCTAIRIMNLAGPLFFAVAGELEAAIDSLARDPTLRVLILRLRQAHDIDITTATVLEVGARKFTSRGKTLILLGLRRPALALLEETGVVKWVGRENIFPARAGWFTAMEAALRRALELTGEHSCGKQCPLEEYLSDKGERRAAVIGP